MLEPTILFVITLIDNIIVKIIIPFSLISIALSIISNISERVKIDKLSKYLNSTAVWILGIILTIFVGVTSLEGSITSSVDGFTAKAAKTAVSSFIPIVGKILGDAVETVMGCANILKNAVGIVGIVVILGICINPIIKLLVLMLAYYIGAAICEPLADEKIIKLLEQIGKTYKLFLAILLSVSVMLIVGITLVISISNSTLMIS